MRIPALLLAACLAASVLLVAAPTASAAPCLKALDDTLLVTCALCNATSLTQVACTAEAGLNAILVCLRDGLPNIMVTCL